ncbi:MAG: cytochrome b N-terminal domain-containing protein, partial [Pirellulales bacterium]
MHRFLNWLDARTGFRQTLAPLRSRVLPNGPSWWFTSASCLLWLLAIEVVTGLLLMTTYSPAMTTAWASVHYIGQSSFGGFVRGLHYYTSHALIILLAVHIVRVLLAAGFRAPRELIWITGLFLMPLLIVWAVTGNPLSASQKGMAQIEVEGNILGSTPVIGSLMQRILIGGDEVGQLTLTHLYFLHVGL